MGGADYEIYFEDTLCSDYPYFVVRYRAVYGARQNIGDLCFFVAILFAVMGVITIATGSTLRGCIGLGVAFLLCPYGLPMLATWLLALCHGFRFWFKDVIYG
jgi:hypothetical protein